MIAPIIMAVAAVAAASMSAMATIKAGKAQAAAGRYNYQVANLNAEQAREAAAAQAQNIAQAGERAQGAARARAGGGGLLLDVGSPLEVLAYNASQIERERIGALNRGETQAMGFEQRGALDRFGGDQARTASIWTAGSTLFAGVSRAAGSFVGGSGSSISGVDPTTGGSVTQSRLY